MALKSKRPAVGTGRTGHKTNRSLSGARLDADLPTQNVQKPPRAAAVETIEARLARKATVADAKTFGTPSLGQMTREERHRLLYGD